MVFWGVDWHNSGTISEKDATIVQISEERDKVNRENERLRNENDQYKFAHDEKTFPL